MKNTSHGENNGFPSPPDEQIVESLVKAISLVSDSKGSRKKSK